jgi:5'-nucleotidase
MKKSTLNILRIRNVLNICSLILVLVFAPAFDAHGSLPEKRVLLLYSEGEDVDVAKAVPGIDVVISGHSHTFLDEATIVNNRTPVVQAGKESKSLGELVITIDNNKLTVESYKLHPIDDSIAGDRAIAGEIDKLKKGVTAAVFASRGCSIDQPLAIAPQDLPNTYSDQEEIKE